MERYEIGDDEQLAAMVEAAKRGEEALFTKDGAVVGSLSPQSVPSVGEISNQALPAAVALTKLRAVHAALPPAWRGTDAAALIREMRDKDGH